MLTPFEFLLGASTIFGAISLAGYDMLRSLTRKGKYRMAYHGRFVWVWMLVGTATGMVFGIPYGHDAPVGLLGFCLLLGWMIGMVHGLVMLPFFRPPVPPSHDPDAD